MEMRVLRSESKQDLVLTVLNTAEQDCALHDKMNGRAGRMYEEKLGAN